MSYYNKENKCPKCGEGCMPTEYHSDKQSKECGCDMSDEFGFEHLSRRCNNCGYKWGEHTRDHVFAVVKNQ